MKKKQRGKKTRFSLRRKSKGYNKERDSSESQSPQYYTVEEIQDKKETNGKVYYYVKWEGFPADQNTWEPAENILDKKVIIQYEKAKRDEGLVKEPESPPKKKEIRIIAEKITLEEDDDEVLDNENLEVKSTPQHPDNTNVIEKVKPPENANIETEKPKDNTDVVETEKPVGDTGIVETEKPMDSTNIVENEKPSDNTNIVEDEKPMENTNIIETEKPMDNTNIVENEKPMDNMNIVENEKPSDNTNIVEDEKPLDKMDVVENEEPSDNKNIVENGTFDKDFPQKIESSYKDKNGDLICVVSWRKRENGVLPKPTEFVNRYLEKTSPSILLKYYEKMLKEHGLL